ncbi:uncharacterized protein MONOS_9358 [Monocercomonoides exilis]|uniref:uncharacterized protein n=1 Tax=Monocercomonoides exilis TaxID=2049356 RepID=UPI003559F453|nr:hypothetical protein MONOS_9358 [Monocercomonoides exilis]|eukprot:MONOS_9358.1-p1 / transcript=MONOS_9358.1 / gene=MONOS_9358 / organism=Monocercomonoides_exilis_PA203 / gene_product=unspecified product / transcript_product=unspecified product / location=Mono_scaffold00384:2611-2951(-) / protein_length=75 / sequence_SO=supercontig / SO=protein_coding / is_pseudo=false
MYREKEEAHEAEQGEKILREARDGCGGRGRQEEGTSNATLCCGGVEAEEDEGFTTRGCLAMERDRKKMEVFNSD